MKQVVLNGPDEFDAYVISQKGALYLFKGIDASSQTWNCTTNLQSIVQYILPSDFGLRWTEYTTEDYRDLCEGKRCEIFSECDFNSCRDFPSEGQWVAINDECDAFIPEWWDNDPLCAQFMELGPKDILSAKVLCLKAIERELAEDPGGYNLSLWTPNDFLDSTYEEYLEDWRNESVPPIVTEVTKGRHLRLILPDQKD